MREYRPIHFTRKHHRHGVCGQHVNAAKALRKYLQFCFVGGVGLVIDMLLFYVLTLWLNLPLIPSKLLAAQFALINNFIWNEVWTFNELPHRRRTADLLLRFVKFEGICCCGILLSAIMLNLQVTAFGVNALVANFIAIVIASIFNFSLCLKFGWSAKDRAC